MTKIKTEKRRAKVGESVLIVNHYDGYLGYKNGDILTVSSTDCEGVGVKCNEFDEVYLIHAEYEVICM